MHLSMKIHWISQKSLLSGYIPRTSACNPEWDTIGFFFRGTACASERFSGRRLMMRSWLSCSVARCSWTRRHHDAGLRKKWRCMEYRRHIYIYIYLQGSINGGTPMAGWFNIRENPMKMDDLGVPPWLKKPSYEIYDVMKWIAIW